MRRQSHLLDQERERCILLRRVERRGVCGLVSGACNSDVKPVDDPSPGVETLSVGPHVKAKALDAVAQGRDDIGTALSIPCDMGCVHAERIGGTRAGRYVTPKMVLQESKNHELGRKIKIGRASWRER